MAISLKEQLKLVKELTYHAPVFDKNYYEDSSLHSDGQTSGTRMFYDFYAIENLWSWVGSGSRPKSERDRQRSSNADTAEEDPLKFQVGSHIAPPRFILPQKEVDLIDDVFEQVTRAVAKNLINYTHLAVVQEFQYLMSMAHGWSKFRQALVASYNKSGNMTKVEFDRLIEKYIPEMKKYPDTVKRLLKYSKYYSSMTTKDGSDVYDVTRQVAGSPKAHQEPEVAPGEPEPDPQPEPMPDTGEPDDTDYSAEPTEVPQGADYDDTPQYDIPQKKDDDDGENYFKNKHKGKLNEEKINPSKIKKVYAAMQKAGVTLDDVEKAYNHIEWGGAYGGPRWGAGAIAMLKLMKAKKTENPEDLSHIIDHIYDLQHNTGSLLNKGPMYVSDEDLNRRFRVTHIARFLPFVSPIIRQVITRYLKYIHGDAELEKQKDAIVKSPSKAFTPEQEQQLLSKGLKKNGYSYKAPITFVNKKKEQISGVFYQITAHQNGKFSVHDNFMADVQVYDTFEEAFQYLMNYERDFVTSGGFSQNVPPPVKSEKDQYIQSHTKIKLAADRETALLDVCKMGWRKKPESQYYKAYFPGSKRFHMYAFSDGSYLCTFNDTDAYKKFTDWDSCFNYCKTATDNALPYPDYDEAKALIGQASGTAAKPAVAPSAPVKSKEYYLEPSEQAQLVALASALGNTTKSEAENGMVNVHTFSSIGNPIVNFSVGKKLHTTFGKPYKIIHQIAGGGIEDWNFKSWSEMYNFIQTYGSQLLGFQPVQAGPQPSSPSSSVTPTAYSPFGKELPSNAVSKAIYTAHVGISTPPKHSIRLTKEDEATITGIGFQPKMVGNDVWYIHKTANDTVKFYPNNQAKIIFTGQTKQPVVTMTIEKMLAWLPSKYNAGSKSPLTAPAAPTSSGMGQAGSKAGSMFEKTITDAGFVWNNTDQNYFDGDNVLTIHPYPKSTIKNLNSGTVLQQFNNLPSLASYLKSEYQAQKKTLTPTAKKSSRGLNLKVKKLLELLKKGGFKKSGVPPSSGKSGTKYTNAQNDVIITYHDHTSMTYDAAHHVTNNFQDIDELLSYLYEKYGSQHVPDVGLNEEEFQDIQASVSANYPTLKAHKWHWFNQPETNTIFIIQNKPLDVGTKVPAFIKISKKGETYTVEGTKASSTLVGMVFNSPDWEAVKKQIYNSLNALVANKEDVNPKPDAQEKFTELNTGEFNKLVSAIQSHDTNKKGYTIKYQDEIPSQPPYAELMQYDNNYVVKYQIRATADGYHINDGEGKTLKSYTDFASMYNDFLDILKYGTMDAASVNDKLTPQESKYIDDAAKEYGWTTNGNQNYIGIVKPTTGSQLHELGGTKYSIRKENGKFILSHNVTQQALGTSDDLALLVQKLKQIMEEDNKPYSGKHPSNTITKEEFNQLRDNIIYEPSINLAAWDIIWNTDTEGQNPFITIRKPTGNGVMTDAFYLYVQDGQYFLKTAGTEDIVAQWSNFSGPYGWLYTVVKQGPQGGDDREDPNTPPTSPGPEQALTEEEFQQVEDLVGKWDNILKVDKAQGQTLDGLPTLYASIKSKDFGHSLWAVAKADGQYVLFKVLGQTWDSILMSQTFEPIYDKLNTVLLSALQQAKATNLSEDEKEWVETFSLGKNPSLKIVKEPEVVFVMEPGEGGGPDNPLFYVQKKLNEDYILRQFTSPQAATFQNYKFATFEEVADYIQKHFTGSLQIASSTKKGTKEEADKFLEDLNYHDIGEPPGEDGAMAWENQYNDTIIVYPEGESTIQPAWGEESMPPMEFHLDTPKELIQYLKLKHGDKIAAATVCAKILLDNGYKAIAQHLYSSNQDILRAYVREGTNDIVWVMKDETGIVKLNGNSASHSFNHVLDMGYALKEYYNDQAQAPQTTSVNSLPKNDDPSSLTYEEAKPIMVTNFYQWGAPPHSYDSVDFKYDDAPPGAGGFGKINISNGNVVKIQIYKTSHSAAPNGLWVIKQQTTKGPKVFSFWDSHGALNWMKTVIKPLFSYTPIDPVATALPPENKKDLHPHHSGGQLTHTYFVEQDVATLAAKVGFHQEQNSFGNLWEHTSKFWFQTFVNGIAWHFEKGSKEIMMPKANQAKFLIKALAQVKPSMTDEDIDKIFSKEVATRREQAFDRLLRIAKTKNGSNLEGTYFAEEMQDRGFIWNEFDNCYMNEEIFQAVVVTLDPKNPGKNVYQIYWINEDETISQGHTADDKTVYAAVGPEGTIMKSGKISMQSSLQQPGWKGNLDPSGEKYIKSGGADAHAIKLNMHDNNLLKKLGFEWDATKDGYSQTTGGSSAYFFSDGTGAFTPPNQHHGKTFNKIPEMLKAMVQTYWTSTPIVKAQNTDPNQPSGELYKTHDEEHNAKLVKLNDHDEDLLEKSGFFWWPSENHYYKNKDTGDILKFYDTGGAVWYEQGGDLEEFQTIPHALKFVTLKYFQGPFSNQNYNENPTDENLNPINLNENDAAVLASIGFKWIEDKKMYLKKIGPTETPKLEEAGKKKKKKEDPNQGELPFNKEDPHQSMANHPANAEFWKKKEAETGGGTFDDIDDEQYEVIYAYNSGNATWTRTTDPYSPGSHGDLETKDGPILDILHFVWDRWSTGPFKTTTQVNTPTPEFVGELMKKNGFSFAAAQTDGSAAYHNAEKNKVLYIWPDGKVKYAYQYVMNPETGELKWDISTLTWDNFLKFVNKKFKPIPDKEKKNQKQLLWAPWIQDSGHSEVGVGDKQSTRVCPPDEIKNHVISYGYKWDRETKQFVNNEDSLDTIIFTSNGDIVWYGGMGTEEKVFSTAEELWKFLDWGGISKGQQKSPQTPTPPTEGKIPMPEWSRFDYKTWGEQGVAEKKYKGNETIQLIDKDAAIMEQLGFKLEYVPSPVYQYQYINKDTNEKVIFYITGNVEYHTSGHKFDYPSVFDILNWLWEKYKNPNTPHVPASSQPKSLKDPKVEASELKKELLEFGFKPVNDDDTQTFKATNGEYFFTIIFSLDDKTVEFMKSQDNQIMDEWTMPVQPARSKLFAMHMSGLLIAPMHSELEKQVKGEPSTERMPWSNTDYKSVFTKEKGFKPTSAISLVPQDEQVLAKLGFVHQTTYQSPIQRYVNPKGEMVAFYADGTAKYWPNKKVAKYEKFPDIKVAAQYVWNKFKNPTKVNNPSKGKSKVPSSGFNYAMLSKQQQIHPKTSIKLVQEDESVMNDMGFVLESKTNQEGYTHNIYIKPNLVQVIFYADGDGMVWDLTLKKKGEPNPPVFKGTVEQCMQFCWENYKDTQPAKKKVTGQMPFSDIDYKKWYDEKHPKVPKNHAIQLELNDELLLTNQLGFHRNVMKTEKDPAFKVSYNGPDNQIMYFFASGKAAYWQNGEGPKYFETVKDAIQFLWDKHMPFIEEKITFKNLMSSLI